MKKLNLVLAGLVALGVCGIRAKADGAPSGQALSAADCGLVKGLQLATAILYWHHFHVRQDTGNAMANALATLSKHAQSPILQMQLQQLAQDILSAPVSSDQERAFANVAQQMTNLQSLCAAPAAPQVAETSTVSQ